LVNDAVLVNVTNALCQQGPLLSPTLTAEAAEAANAAVTVSFLASYPLQI